LERVEAKSRRLEAELAGLKRTRARATQLYLEYSEPQTKHAAINSIRFDEPWTLEERRANIVAIEEKRKALQKILKDSPVREAFEELVRAGCHAEMLDEYLLEKPRTNKRQGAAENKDRKEDLESLAKTLERAAELIRRTGIGPDLGRYGCTFANRQVCDLSGDQLPSRDKLVTRATRFVKRVAKAQVLPLFSPRQYQQFRFLEFVHWGKHRYYRQVAHLLASAYTYHGIPKEEHPSEESLSKLVLAYNANRRKHSVK